MRLDVIVCTYNRAGLLRGAVESLVRQDTGGGFTHRVLVVDNASSDDTRAVVESLAAASPVEVGYALEPAAGVPHARNRGVRAASADWIAFFDDDQLADPGWARELLAVAAAHGARCVSGRLSLRTEDGAPPPRSAFCRGLLGETAPAAAPRPFAGKLLPGTNNVLLHREVLDRVGPFDTGLVGGGDDAEFFRRVRRAGFEIWYAPAARALHRVPPYRLTADYLRWVASRHGSETALADYREGGRRRVVRDGLLRAGQALLGTAPRHLRALAARDAAAQLDARCQLARALAYERQALRLVAPRLFSQEGFFGGLEFRGERARFGPSIPGRAA